MSVDLAKPAVQFGPAAPRAVQNPQLRVLDLFSGIGGFSLGLERTGGFETVAFCEIDPFCRKVLAKHWPGVPCYDDIRQLTAERLAADGIVPDVLCGGFPCQDISTAGKGAGIDAERSGLWREYARLIGEIRPRYVIVENVAALLGRGLDRVLGDLATLGFDAEWHCIPASAVGAPHRRDRVWIVAYPADCIRRPVVGGVEHRESAGEGTARGWDVCAGNRRSGDDGSPTCSADVADAAGQRREWRQGSAARLPWADRETDGRAQGDGGPVGDGQGCRSRDLADAREPRLSESEREAIRGEGRWHERRATAECSWWEFEPDVGRVAHGIPARVDRLRSLGNAVVPQVVELIGRAILEATGAREAPSEMKDAFSIGRAP